MRAANEDGTSTRTGNLAQLVQSCNSITKKALSVKALTKFDDIDARIQQEKEIGNWMDRQTIDSNHTYTAATESELESAWNQHQQSLLSDRIKVSICAQVALKNDETLSGLALEALDSRDTLAERIAVFQNQVSSVRQELEALTRNCRTLQRSNREQSKTLQSNQEAVTGQRDEQLERRSTIIRRVLADLILGAELDLHERRLAKTFLVLEE